MRGEGRRAGGEQEEDRGKRGGGGEGRRKQTALGWLTCLLESALSSRCQRPQAIATLQAYSTPSPRDMHAATPTGLRRVVHH